MSLRRQLPLFLLVGGASAGIDAAVYTAGSALSLPVAPAKACGFIAGATFGFLANGRKTFAGPHRPGTLARFALVYASSMQLNVLVNAAVLAIVADLPGGTTLAFVLATACSAATNFAGMRHFVFRTVRSSVPA